MSDATANASPRPWRVNGPFPGKRETKRQHGFREYSNVLDRNGIYIAQNLAPGTAALIVEAVNERERLRDLVKRMAAYIQVGAIGGALLREARDAIGESEEDTK